MPRYYATDDEFTSVADAIREKINSNESLEWPDEFVEAIENISDSSGLDIEVSDPTGVSF